MFIFVVMHCSYVRDDEVQRHYPAYTTLTSQRKTREIICVYFVCVMRSQFSQAVTPVSKDSSQSRKVLM